MRDTYSLYEAKARLSAIVRQVREGRSVVVTVHGEPVAEIRPYPSGASTIDERLNALSERGIIQRADPKAASFAASVRKPGALRRFLEERGE